MPRGGRRRGAGRPLKSDPVYLLLQNAHMMLAGMTDLVRTVDRSPDRLRKVATDVARLGMRASRCLLKAAAILEGGRHGQPVPARKSAQRRI